MYQETVLIRINERNPGVMSLKLHVSGRYRAMKQVERRQGTP